jgi:hypothetical protein
MKGEHGWIHVSPAGVFCPPSQNEQGEVIQTSVAPDDSTICQMWERLDQQRANAEAGKDAGIQRICETAANNLVRAEKAEAALAAMTREREAAIEEEQHNAFVYGWREGWEAAKASSDRVPHIHDALDAAKAALLAERQPPQEGTVQIAATEAEMLSAIQDNEPQFRTNIEVARAERPQKPPSVCRCRQIEKRARAIRMADVLRMEHDSELMKELRAFDLVVALQMRVDELEKRLRVQLTPPAPPEAKP